MGNCVGQRRFDRKGSGKGATPKTPTKEEGDKLKVDKETGKITTTTKQENLTKKDANQPEEVEKAKHAAGGKQINTDREERHVEGKEVVKNEKENGIDKNDLCKNLEEEGKVEVKSPETEEREIEKQELTNKKEDTDLLNSWVVFDESIVEEKGTAQTCKTNGDEMKSVTTSDKSSEESTDDNTEASSDSPPASPFESDFVPKFEAVNATENEKGITNKAKSADLDNISAGEETDNTTEKQHTTTTKTEDYNHSHEILNKNAPEYSQEEKELQTKKNSPSPEDTDVQTSESKKFQEPCDQGKVPEVLQKITVEEEHSTKHATHVIDVEKALFIDKLYSHNVLLENISISGREVSGFVAVAIKGDESLKVLIRYTTDSWKSFTEEEAVPSSTETDQIYKKFSFSIFVPFGSSLEFAIECLKGDFICWDNNNDSNYFVDNCMEIGELEALVPRFLIPLDAVFAYHIRKKFLCLKKACFKDGEASIYMATNATSHENPGVRYTLDNWQTFTDIKGCKIYETKHGQLGLGYDVCRANVEIPKGKTLMFVVFGHHEGQEDWDNNDGKNYEING